MIITSFWQVVGATIVSFILFHVVLYSLSRLVDNINRQNSGQNKGKHDISGEDFDLSVYRLGKNGEATSVEGAAMSPEELTKIIDALRVARAKAEEDEEDSGKGR